jgi:hypothetical protein
MDAPRTPFADAAAPSPRSAVIIPFPAEAVAWCRDLGEAVAVIDAAGNVLRYRSERALRAAVLNQHRSTEEAANRQEAAERAFTRRKAFDAAPWWSRLHFIIAGAGPTHWVAGCIGAAAGCVAYIVKAAL